MRQPHVHEQELELAVLHHGVRIYCLGETVAVRLFRRLREGCTVAVARKALDRILKDEVFHRDFGWTLLERLLSSPAHDRYVAILARDLGSMIAAVQADYVRDRQEAVVTPERLRAWGLMGIGLYREAFFETMEKDYTPRFEGLGIVVPEAAR